MALRQFVVKDAITVRDDVLRTIKNGLIQQGISNPYVGPASDYHIIATALGNELAVVGASCVVKADAQMPDTAEGEDLEREGDLLERTKQGAAGSIGGVVLEASASSPIETGRELNDSAGLRYEVIIGGTYADGATVPIRAIDTGSATNHAAGDVLRWVSAPPYSAPTALVATGGLTNGIDEEDDEVFRARILSVYQNPPGAGNWEHVAEMAEESIASVQKAFVYPAVQGPGSLHVAVAAAPTEDSVSRVIASATVSGVVDPYIKGTLPTHAHIVTTTVTDVNTDVAIGLSLPEAPTANPPGSGGGWLNGTPWPSVDASTTFRCTVTAVTSTTQFTVDATTAPTVNVTRIAWYSHSEQKLYTGLVTASSGSSGEYLITVDNPFTAIAVGAYIWPECQNAETYVAGVLAHFKLMGPGEKTDNASALVRGFRHPVPSTGWPYSVGPFLLRDLSDTGDEVLDAQFLHRTDGTTTKQGSTGLLTPQVPAVVTDPPNQFIPRHIAFYRLP